MVGSYILSCKPLGFSSTTFSGSFFSTTVEATYPASSLFRYFCLILKRRGTKAGLSSSSYTAIFSSTKAGATFLSFVVIILSDSLGVSSGFFLNLIILGPILGASSFFSILSIFYSGMDNLFSSLGDYLVSSGTLSLFFLIVNGFFLSSSFFYSFY